MKTRIISGAVLVVIGLVTIWLGGPVLMATLLFCAEVGLMEYYRACGLIGREKKIPGMAVAAFAGTAVYYCLLLTGLKNHYGVIASLVLVVVLMCYVGAFPKYRAEQAAEAGFGFFWVAVMLSYIFLIRDERDGLLNVWLVFLSSWVADTGAYFVGRACGKHKMTPLLSPHKTIEGAVGGILCAGLSGILFKALVGLLAGLWPTVFVNSDAHMWQYFVVCAAGSVISIFGDLCASAIKRDKAIKDYGKLIPGHGGILDRFDSVIFTAPIIYFLTQLLLVSH